MLSLMPAVRAWGRERAPELPVTAGEYWRTQGVRELAPLWLRHAPDPGQGAYHTNLDRRWRPIPPAYKVPLLIGRQVYGFSAAYLLSGREEYLACAKQGVEYLLDRAWDKEYGGWHDLLTPEGKPLSRAKTVSRQLYTNVGLTMYYFTTGCARVLEKVIESVEIHRERARDREFGGYAQTLRRDLAVADYGKNKHAHYGYTGSLLLNLYLATRDARILAFSRELMDLSLERMRDGAGWFHGFKNTFDRQWRRTDPAPDRPASGGAQLTAGLALLRLADQTGGRYARTAIEFARQVEREAWDAGSGGWFETTARSRGDGMWWWTQIYGAMLQLRLYARTREQCYLDNFGRSERFFVSRFTDREQGGFFTGIGGDGRPLGEGRKAWDTAWRASYHEMEHALVNYLYLSLLSGHEPQLTFRLAGGGPRFVVPFDQPDVRIAAAWVDGKPWKSIDRETGYITLPKGTESRVVISYKFA